MRTFNFLLLAGSILLVGGCGDDAVQVDMSPPDLSMPDLQSVPDFARPDAAGISCGNSTCGGTDVCCAQLVGGNSVQATCMPAGTCADGGTQIACDGPEDCSGGTGECCTTINVMFSTTDGGPPPSGGGDVGCVGSGKCIASAVISIGNGTATVHTRLCHFNSDCNNLNGMVSLGTGGSQSTPFTSCCASTQVQGFQFCAPAPSQLTAGLYDCQP